MTETKLITKIAFSLIFAVFILAGCGKSNQIQLKTRAEAIPASAVKITPQTDQHPPILLSDEWEKPILVPGPINTAGAEDSPFITPDGNTLYFFFTPDPNIPVEKQISDGVTGIYVSHKQSGVWSEPERILLNKPGKLGSDGCEFVQGDTMWFCSVREGYAGIHWFIAKLIDGQWQDWKLADFNPDYKVGELHITANGDELYFGSDRAGGRGGLDIWKLIKVNNEWQNPENITVVNTAENEGWPYISQDGNELWFTRQHGANDIWRSKKVNGEWQVPEKIIETLAGEPTLDNAGNLYFTHHYYKDDKMLEADIYIAKKK